MDLLLPAIVILVVAMRLDALIVVQMDAVVML